MGQLDGAVGVTSLDNPTHRPIAASKPPSTGNVLSAGMANQQRIAPLRKAPLFRIQT